MKLFCRFVLLHWDIGPPETVGVIVKITEYFFIMKITVSDRGVTVVQVEIPLRRCEGRLTTAAAILVTFV